MAKALIVVDIQNDFCEGGSLGVDGGKAVAAAIAKTIEENKGGYDYVLATRDHHIDPGSHFSDHPDFIDSWPPHCVVGTKGQELNENLVDYAFDGIFDKGSYRPAYSGFEGTIGGDDDGISLEDWLNDHNVEEVDVSGIATDYCVKQTAEDASRLGFDTTVLLDLCATIHPENMDQVKEDWSRAKVSWK